MKFARFLYKAQIHYGLVEGETITLLEGNIFDNYRKSSHKINVGDVKLLAPSTPSKIICVGLNYRDHAHEMNLAIPTEPVLFMKPNTAVVGPFDDVVYPNMSRQVDYEAELGIVIGKKAKDIKVDQAEDFILGYTCANDVTARDLQNKDGQWTRAKSFDTFMPFGPYIVTDLNPNDLKIELYVNDEIRQNSNTNQMIFDCPNLVSFISQIMTLYPGDLIITGTPHGIGTVRVGDRMRVNIEHIGFIENKVTK